MSSVCLFLIYNVELVIGYVGGPEFSNAKEVVIFSLIWTVFRVRSQFSTLMIESFEDTKILKRINFVNYAASFPLVFILVAPKKYLGLELGAVGLFIKIIFTQQVFNFFLLKQISNYFEIKILRTFFKDYFFYFCSILCFVLPKIVFTGFFNKWLLLF